MQRRVITAARLRVYRPASNRLLQSQSKLLHQSQHKSYNRSFSAPAPQYPVTVSPENTPATIPVDLDIAAKIEGEESHVVTITLEPNQAVRAEAGALVYMTDGVVMETSLQGASSAFQRFMTGQNLFLTDYKYIGDSNSKGTVCLGTDFPSKILKFNLQDFTDNTIICQKGAFLASNVDNVEIQMEFTKSFKAGFFGGQGFVLQKISGQGNVLVKGGGTIVERALRPGETLRVSSGSIVAFESSVSYDVSMMPGIKNAMFGGEGLFITTLQGPGRIWLQGLPPDRMIAEIARRVPGPGIGLGVPIGGFGGSGSTDGDATEGDATEGTDGEVATDSAAEQVAATDAAVEADRQATVASSGVMPDSTADTPEALFGDAAAPDAASVSDDSDSFASSDIDSTYGQDDIYNDDFVKADSQFGTDENTTEEFSSGFDNDAADGELFDNTSASSSDVGPSDDGGGGSRFSSLWDFFMRGDDE